MVTGPPPTPIGGQYEHDSKFSGNGYRNEKCVTSMLKNVHKCMYSFGLMVSYRNNCNIHNVTNCLLFNHNKNTLSQVSAITYVIHGLNENARIHIIHTIHSLHYILVRLSDGSGPHEGRVEISHDGEWGTVCNDQFDDIDASTVCWQLGYHTGSAMVDLEFGAGSGPIWLDNVECDGLSPEIGACAHNCWGCHDCGHFEDVGVSCSKCGSVSHKERTVEPQAGI